MAVHYQHWQSSDLSQVAYSKAHGLTFHKFNYWCRKFQQPAAESDTGGFVSVRVKESANASAIWLEVERADGSKIRFYQPVEAAFLKTLLS